MILQVVWGFRLGGSGFGLRVLWLDLWIWVEALGLNFTGHLRFTALGSGARDQGLGWAKWF